MSFVDGDPGNEFDVVLVMNALTYVTPDQQRAAIKKIASYSRRFMALTAFHPDTIRRDVSEVGFKPYLENQEAIHAAWGDRLTDQAMHPSSPDYSWRLPPFSRACRDYEFRFTSFFERR